MDQLFEREHEVDRLDAALGRAASGTGSVVIVEGTAGIGKSRLLAAARERAADMGLRALTAQPNELERDAAFGAAIALLAPATSGRARDPALFGGLAGLTRPLFEGREPAGVIDPDGLRIALYWLVVNLAAARSSQPGLALLVDDAQWADPPSLRFLLMLAAAIDELPVALVAAIRTGEPDAPKEELDRLRALPGAQILTPAPLSAQAVTRLVDAALPATGPEVAQACRRVTGGNPLLLRELLLSLRTEGVEHADGASAAVEETVPEAVRASVALRLRRMTPSTRRLAEAVAVLDKGASLDRAAGVAQLDVEEAGRAADALAERHLLEAGAPLRFTHPLLASAVRSDMGAFQRSGAHQRAARLGRLGGDPPERVAAHLLHTAPTGDADTVATLRESARRALGRGAPRSARRLLGRALEEPPRACDTAAVLTELAAAELAAGVGEPAAHLEQALGRLREPARRAQALLSLARARIAAGDRAGAVRACDQAVASLPPGDPAFEAFLAEYLSIVVLQLDERLGEAARYMAPILERVRAGHLAVHPTLLAHVLTRLQPALDPAPLIRAVSERAVAEDPLIDPRDDGALVGIVSKSLTNIDELALAERIAGSALVAAQRRGLRPVAANSYAMRAAARYHRGALLDARDDLEQFLALEPALPGLYTASTGRLLAHVEIERGDLPAAERALAQARAASAAVLAPAVLNAEARLALAAGRSREALEAAQAAGRAAIDRGIDHPRLLPWRGIAALAHRQLGEHARARAVAEEAVSLARGSQIPRVIAVALRAAGLVAERERGLVLLDEAVAVSERSQSRLEHARCLIDFGAALRRAGRRRAARGPLARGLELAEPMRAAPLAEQARSELRALGSRPRRAALTGVDALTASERRVAALAAAGRTNLQIAQSLFVTVKTVEAHLHHAYGKLGITSRRALPAALAAPASGEGDAPRLAAGLSR